MMKKLLSFLLSFLSVAVFFSCNNEQKDLPNLDVNSKSLHLNTTIGLSSTRSLEITAEHSGDDGQQMRATIDFANDTWNNRTNKPDLYVVVGSKPVVKVPNSNYSYQKNGSTSSLHLNLSLQYDNETDDVRLYLVDKTISVDRDNGTLTFPNQNEIVSPLNGDGTKPAYKLLFYGKTTIANLKTANAGFNLKPLGTLVLFSTNNQSGSAISIADNTSVSLTTDCFVFTGNVNMRTGLNSSTETNSQTLTFTLSNGGEAVANSSRGNIYGLYVLGKSKTGGTITLPLTDQFTATKTVAHNFQTEYNGKTVGINLDAEDDDPTKYFVVEVARNSNTGRYSTQWNRNVYSGLQYSYRALDERGEPIGEWVSYEELPNNRNNYLARMYDPQNNYREPGPREENYRFKCPENTVKVVQWGKMKWRTVRRLFSGCSQFTSIETTDRPNFDNCFDFAYMFNECRTFNGSVSNFNTSNVTSMTYMFNNCSSFNQSVDNFDTSKVTNMSGMFNNCSSFNQSVSNFNTSNVTDMSYMFYSCYKFNQPVDNFDTSKVTNMSKMFAYCRNFNQSVDNFDTSKVTDMSGMFTRCRYFKQPVSNFNTEKVTDMREMFSGCESFNQPVSNFNTSNVTTMSRMFSGCTLFNQSVSNFNTSNVTSMTYMFNDCSSFNQSVDNFDTSKVTNMSGMFNNCSSFNQSVSNFNTSNVTTMEGMFTRCYKFNQPVDNFDTSKVTNMSGMFASCSEFNQPVSNFNTSNVTTMERMFSGCTLFNQSVSNFNTEKVTYMREMFSGCESFNQPVNNFNTSNVRNMESMFYNCYKFNQPVDNFDTSKVTNMSEMFHNCHAFNQPVSNFNTSNVRNMEYMFTNCIQFNQSVSHFDTSNVTTMREMFHNCHAFNQSVSHFDTSKVRNMRSMFSGCESFNQNIRNWNVQNVRFYSDFHKSSALTQANCPPKLW